MKVKDHLVLEMCIADGVAAGVRKAHKHTDNPSQDWIIQAVEAEVMNMVHEWFDMEPRSYEGVL